MEATKYLTNYKIIIVNVLFLLLFISLVININQDFPFYHNVILRIVTYVIISGVAVFYIHSLVLLPILQQEADKRKYRNYVFVIAIVYFLFLLVFWIINRENLERSVFNLSKDSLIRTAAILFVLSVLPLIVTLFLSYTYTAIFLNKKGRLNFLEFLINFIVVGFFLAVTATSGQIEVTVVTLIVVAVFYIHSFFIVPLFTKSKRKKYFSFLLVLSVFYLVSIYSNLNHPLTFYTSEDIFQFVFFMIGSLLLVLFLSFVYGYFRLKIVSKEKLFTLKLGVKDSELQLLKSQVNPHFLFNTLNTLYATALEEKANKTAESTAKLASLIRYMQEDINKDFIPLVNEIKYLQDYIAIQKLRCAVEPDIEAKFDNIENHRISPGLLIPFVENAFKYGIDPSKPSKLKVSVICDDNTIHFECINSYKDDFKIYYKEQGFGIGIKNAKQRLELVYPKKHTFEVDKENNTFSVKMSIKTK